MRVKVRRSGTVFIGATVFLGVAAANTGNNLLYIVVSAMLSLMLVSGVVSILNIRGIEVRLIPPLEVFAGRRVRFRVLVRKGFRVPSFLIRLSSDVDEVLFPLVDDRWREERLYLLFNKRGRVDRVKLILSSDFPLGMFVRSMEVEVKTDIIVFPKPVPTAVPIGAADKRKESGSSRPTSVKGYEEFKGIKDYAGEPMKLIHWKLTAKRGEITVREMLSEDKEPVILSLDIVDGDLETRLSKLAYLTVRFIDEGYPVGLKLNGKELPPERGELQKVAILRELALY